ncbi:hypothetical protein [Nocardia otitidiscaviarum]|uniref:hypothetical protein n=1 Tax=Nocardia otitidiscaviarum TaxID=1823 RepID=UPI002453C147|nr:hypothetical protein [Nocardia otitidiscaviarum]
MRRSRLVAALAAGALLCSGAARAEAAPRPVIALGGGMGVAMLHGVPLAEATWMWFCTLTAVGYDRHSDLVGITNAHCVYDRQGRQWPGDEVVAVSPAGDTVVGRVEFISGGNPLVPGPNGPGLDYAVIVFDRSVVTPLPTVVGNPVRRIAPPPPPGTTLCKLGITTGLTCGVMLGTVGPYVVNSVTENIGDSGAPIVVGDALVASQWLTGGATAMTAIVADLDRRGGAGAGFRLIPA